MQHKSPCIKRKSCQRQANKHECECVNACAYCPHSVSMKTSCACLCGEWLILISVSYCLWTNRAVRQGYPSIHPSSDCYPGQGGGGIWSFSQKAQGRRPGCVLDGDPAHHGYIHTYSHTKSYIEQQYKTSNLSQFSVDVFVLHLISMFNIEKEAQLTADYESRVDKVISVKWKSRPSK